MLWYLSYLFQANYVNVLNIDLIILPTYLPIVIQKIKSDNDQ